MKAGLVLKGGADRPVEGAAGLHGCAAEEVRVVGEDRRGKAFRLVIYGLIVIAAVSLSGGKSARAEGGRQTVHTSERTGEKAGPVAQPQGPEAERPTVSLTAATAGCKRGLPQGLKAGTTTVRTISSGGMKRQYRLHLPPESSATALPLVLNFHGRYGTAQDQESYSGLLPISDREHFLLVSPDGTGDPRGWSAGATPPNGVDDVRFVSELLDTLGQELCIDPGRVYATGFSNGAFMVSRLGCELSERVAAIAPVGGVDYPVSACGGPVPVLAVHGTDDPVVPLAGGQVRRWTYQGARVAMAAWAVQNHCEPSFRTSAISPTTRWDGYQACAAETAMIVVQGGGHTWPGAPDAARPGTSADDISAAEMIWTFFSNKSRP